MPFASTRRDALLHLWALLLAKSLVSSRCCLCSASFDGGTASSLEAPIHPTPPGTPPRRRGFHDEPSIVSSLCCSAAADIAWSPLLDLSLQSKRNPMAPLVNMYRCRESGESSGFKASGKSQVMGLQRGSSTSALSEFLLTLNLLFFLPYLVFPF